MKPQTSAAIQAAINADGDVGQAMILDRGGRTIATLHAPPLAPIIKTITQQTKQWYQADNTGPTNISNICVTDGGILKLSLPVNPSQIVTLTNVGNLKGPDAGGYYAILLWPPGDQHSQQAIPKFTLDNSASDLKIYQGEYEAAIRGKCDDATFINANIVGYLNGKPPLEIRHGKSWAFNGGSMLYGYPEIGQQLVLGPDGKTSSLVTTQHVGTVTFTNFKFGLWTADHKCYARKPGVDKIVCIDCLNPDGVKFSSQE